MSAWWASSSRLVRNRARVASTTARRVPRRASEVFCKWASALWSRSSAHDSSPRTRCSRCRIWLRYRSRAAICSWICRRVLGIGQGGPGGDRTHGPRGSRRRPQRRQNRQKEGGRALPHPVPRRLLRCSVCDARNRVGRKATSVPPYGLGYSASFPEVLHFSTQSERKCTHPVERRGEPTAAGEIVIPGKGVGEWRGEQRNGGPGPKRPRGGPPGAGPRGRPARERGPAAL